MRNIEFVSYDGKYPNLCSGTLKLRVDGKIWQKSHCLISGGRCSWEDEDQNIRGPWDISSYDFNDFTVEEQVEIQRLVNDNVEWGCCGGCI